MFVHFAFAEFAFLIFCRISEFSIHVKCLFACSSFLSLSALCLFAKGCVVFQFPNCCNLRSVICALGRVQIVARLHV